jgi:hypothetical protein
MLGAPIGQHIPVLHGLLRTTSLASAPLAHLKIQEKSLRILFCDYLLTELVVRIFSLIISFIEVHSFAVWI